MLLAIDIGNTCTNFGLFSGAKLVKTWSAQTSAISASALRPAGKIEKVIISSVVPSVDKKLAALITKKLKIKPIFVNAYNIQIKVRANKKQVGADRVVNAFASHKIYGGDLVVLDFGTATTFDAVSRSGEYLGGAIVQGILMSSQALYEKTAKLPKVKIKPTNKLIGQTTAEAIDSGVFLGYIDLISGMIMRFKKKMGKDTRIVATGGFAGMFCKYIRAIDIIDSDLTLKGLSLTANVRG